MQRAVAMNLLKRNVISHPALSKTALSTAEKLSDDLSVVVRGGPNQIIRSPCDVFINHRGIDTKRTVATLLYDHLCRLKLRPFLDNKSMKPGDKLFDKINDAIKRCKIGVLVFSPRYCESYFCLHELALMTETKKKLIPIFCDIKPSELCVVNNGSIPPNEVERFNLALQEARYTVGLTFDSHKGNWLEVVTSTANVVTETLMEVEDQEEQIYI